MNYVTLNDVVVNKKNAIVDGPFGSNLKVSDYVDHGIPVLQGQNITNNIYRWTKIRFITEEKAEELKRSRADLGDILIVKIGSIGYCAEVTNLGGFPYAIIPANLAKATVDESKINKRFLIRWLNSPMVLTYLKKNASQTAQPALSLSKIKQIPIPLISAKDQILIADKIDKVFTIVQKRKQAIQLLDAHVTSVFAEMFGDPISNPKLLEVIELGKLTKKITDGTHKTPKYTTSGVKFISAKNIKEELIDWNSIKYISEEEHRQLYKRCNPERDDLLLTKSGSLGMAAIVNVDFEFSLFESLALLKIKKELIDPIYLREYLNLEQVKSLYLKITKGVGVKHLHLIDIKSLPIVLPSITEQKKFRDMIIKNKTLKQKMLTQADLFETQFQSLMQRSFQSF